MTEATALPGVCTTPEREPLTGWTDRSRGYVHLHVENTYADGHECSYDVDFQIPRDLTPQQVAVFVDEEAWNATGCGNGLGRPGLGSTYKVTVVECDVRTSNRWGLVHGHQLQDHVFEWED